MILCAAGTELSGLREEMGVASLAATLLFHFFALYVWLPVVICAPLLIALANLINKPLEQSISNGFIRDAQRILKEQPKLRIIGVTGSFGKTSVKYYLTTLLSEQFSVLMTPESYNTPMGIVRTIREQMKPTHEVFVCEMGARHVNDIKEITDFVHPDDGIVTAIGEQHLETFHSLDNIIATKYELIDAVEEKHPAECRRVIGENHGRQPSMIGEYVIGAEGIKLVNGDDENIRANMKYPDAVTYGLKEGNDFRAIDIEVTPAGTTFKIQLSPQIARRLQSEHGYAVADARRISLDGKAAEDAQAAGVETAPSAGDDSSPGISFHTSLVGAHNVQNIMGAIAAATLYGIPASKLKRAVRRIEGVPHRLELKRHGNVTILDDAYNANPTGAKTALETLALFRDRVKILVTPGMVELGEKEEEYNEAFGAQAAGVCDYIIFVGNAQRTAALVRGAKKAGFDETRLFVKDSFNEASVLMYELDAGREKVILLENDLPDNY
ncbi:MAG: UDP-N-acetylmuramoyl-tripeptide--D-alanyl-D-alanine ligase [Lachnospiraceae bacterium]|nr:UDP-N-acetylmuramoyl-tripeptide--D-alanyl-D-alanine ligase [Lachnospiraceae bacterium]